MWAKCFPNEDIEGMPIKFSGNIRLAVIANMLDNRLERIRIHKQSEMMK